jgi:two-component system, NarL family, sensor kinase
LRAGRYIETALPSRAATTEAERLVGWLRLPLIALIVMGQTLVSAEPSDSAFAVVLVVYSGWSVAVLVWVYSRSVGPTLSVLAIMVDIAAITALATLSGGPFSEARRAYLVVPVAVAFRFRPMLTGAASAITVAAFLSQAIAHSASALPGAKRQIATDAGFLVWVGVAASLLSFLLARRTQSVERLAASRQRLIADALNAEERERQQLAESLHDHAIQNLLAARHDLQEASDSQRHPALDRAEEALAAAVADLRSATFELHPHVLEQAGLESAIAAVAERNAERGGFRVTFDHALSRASPDERLLYAAARELLSNVASHAGASEVRLTLTESDGNVVLRVADDGCGFDVDDLPAQLAQGHIGIASQRARIESAGGSLTVTSRPGRGTTTEVRVPIRG